MIKFTSDNTPLPQEELIELLDQVKQGSLEARNKIIEHNLKFVYLIANRFSMSDNVDDLFSVGVIGLTKGVERFDKDAYHINAFSTFIGKCIENEIRMHLRKLKSKVAIVSIEEDIGSSYSTNGDDELSLSDTLKEDNMLPEKATSRLELYTTLHKLIKDLPPQEQYIINAYFGIGDLNNLNYEYMYSESFGTNEPTLIQQKIADNLKLSRSHISKKTQDILKKLKTELTEKGFSLDY